MLLCGIVNFMVGPSPYLPNSVIIMAIGQFFNGMFANFFLITTLPVLIQDAVEGFPKNKIEVTDKSSGVVSSMFSLGQAIGPIYGSNMISLIGFRWCADTIAIMLIIYSLIYFVVWRLWKSSASPPSESDQSTQHNFETVVSNTLVKDQTDSKDSKEEQ